MSKPSAPGTAVLAMLALVIIWGYNWVVMKIGINYSSPFDFAAMRAFFGAVSLFLVMIWLRKPIYPQEIPRTFLTGILQRGTLGFSMWALVSGSAGKTAILVYTMPFWLVLPAWFILGEHLQKLQWVCVSLALGGLLFILMPFSLADHFLSKGLALLAAISWRLHTTQASNGFDLASHQRTLGNHHQDQFADDQRRQH